ncbi:MAG: hypothetical protein ACLSHC_08330 [Bilophila wadsworthia]
MSHEIRTPLHGIIPLPN